MKLKTFCLSSLVSLAALSAHADIFRMNDGSRIEGEIALETTDSYIITVESTPGVRDQVTLKKSEVRYKTKSRKKSASSSYDDSKEQFKALRDLLPTGDLLCSEDYDSLIEKNIVPLIKAHPESKYLRIAQEVQTALLAEQARVKNGEVKLNGKWLTADEKELNLYGIEAAELSNQISSALSKGDYPSAFSTLAVMQKEFKNTKQFRDSLAQTLDAIPKYKAKAQKILDNHSSEIKKRDTKFERLTAGGKKKFELALAKEESSYQKALAKAKSKRSKWLPLNRFHPQIAKRTISYIEREHSKLEELNGAAYTDAAELYKLALTELKNGDLKAAEVHIRAFKKGRPSRKFSTLLTDKKKSVSITLREAKRKKAKAAQELRRQEREAKRKAREQEPEETADSSNKKAA